MTRNYNLREFYIKSYTYYKFAGIINIEDRGPKKIKVKKHI